MVNFQSYINENGIVIESKSAEATDNGWCQEIKVKELKEMLDAEKKEKSFWNKIIKALKGGKKNESKKI